MKNTGRETVYVENHWSRWQPQYCAWGFSVQIFQINQPEVLALRVLILFSVKFLFVSTTTLQLFVIDDVAPAAMEFIPNVDVCPLDDVIVAVVVDDVTRFDFAAAQSLMLVLSLSSPMMTELGTFFAIFGTAGVFVVPSAFKAG